MLMIIFGAGASYDSCSRVPQDPRQNPRSPARNRPPLADGLFNVGTWGDEIERHQDCILLFSYLRGASSVEEELERIHGEAQGNPSLARAMFGLRAYLKEVIDTSSKEWFHSNTRGDTNYVRLLGDVDAWRIKNNETVCLVTFNYDTLLDDACRDTHLLEFADMASYVKGLSYRLFKLHGSVNWHRLIRNVRGSPVDSLEQLEWTDTYTLNTRNPPLHKTEAYVPAIAIPTITKSGFECPPSHVEALKSALPQVNRLLVIGWRGMEEHFLRLWADTHPKVMHRIQIVSGSQSGADAVRDRLERIGIGLDPQLPRLLHYYGRGFSNFLVEKQLERFLYD